MKDLHIDIETFSSIDLGRSSVYRYAESEDFEILLFGYSVDGGDVHVVNLAMGEQIPDEVIDALTDNSVRKWAHNANFERVCLSSWLGIKYLDPDSWYCTQVWAAYLGLPLSLKDVGTALDLDKQKMTEGASLIRLFCKPDKEGKRQRAEEEPEKWTTFKAYNVRDVETEMAIQQRLSRHPVPAEVWAQYHLDQRINDRGIAVDMDLVEKAIAMDAQTRSELTAKLQEITELDNPNSVAQMKNWLTENGLETETLDKKQIQELLKTAPEHLKSVLELRLQLSKSSVKKYEAIQRSVCSDGRVRGMFQFYGAHTGRWAGRILNFQNLPRNDMEGLDKAREDVKAGKQTTPDVLSQLVRTAFVPAKGKTFFAADFAAIEARVIAWLAGEEWRMELFKNGGDIYCQSASQMFHVPVEKHGINGELRQKGKIAELACIAQGSLVLTDHGLIPIEDVQKKYRVWDGCEWVEHGGVICRGEREVIEYEGLCATPDHLVWIEGQREPIEFGEAAAKGAHLINASHTVVNPAVRKCGKVKVLDLLDCGPRHRYTVSGKLVHNCGYGGSVGALKAFGALEMGLKEEELKPIVNAWRKASPKIVDLWWDVDTAATLAIAGKKATETDRLRFECKSGILFITLPSGRQLAYVKPKLGENRFGSTAITYMGLNEQRKWARIETYGAKLVENITQAVARDVLAYAMNTLKQFVIVAHVHDELIIEAEPEMRIEDICAAMSRTPPWAEGLILNADGFECEYYRKE